MHFDLIQTDRQIYTSTIVYLKHITKSTTHADIHVLRTVIKGTCHDIGKNINNCLKTELKVRSAVIV